MMTNRRTRAVGYRTLLAATCVAWTAGCADGDTNRDASDTINVEFACNFNSILRDEELPFELPAVDAVDAVRGIVQHIGLPQNFDLYGAEISNAAAAIIDGRRIILYDPALIRLVRDESGSNWSAIAILAHEVAHHLAGHTLAESETPLEDELEADRFAGFVVSQMGASLEEAQLAIRLLSQERASASHPGRSRRLRVTEAGWSEATELRVVGARPPLPPDDVFEPGLYGGVYKTLFEVYDLYPKAWTGDFLVHPDSVAAEALAVTATFPACSVDGPYTAYMYRINEESIIDPFSMMAYILEFEDGERQSFYLPVEELCNACRSNLDMAMVPGRRLRITYSVCGNGGIHQITSLEVLRASNG